MSIQKKAESTEVSGTSGVRQSGNSSAGAAAARAKGVIEHVIGPALATKLSDIPDRADRLRALADIIERHELTKRDIGFNMGPYWRRSHSGDEDQTGKGCGTVACIAGWAAAFDGAATVHTDSSSIAFRAKNILGLSENESTRLFGAYGCRVDLHSISVPLAVAVIRDFADTGEINWHKFDNKGRKIK